jgi:hypothetical protein
MNTTHIAVYYAWFIFGSHTEKNLRKMLEAKRLGHELLGRCQPFAAFPKGDGDLHATRNWKNGSI